VKLPLLISGALLVIGVRVMVAYVSLTKFFAANAGALRRNQRLTAEQAKRTSENASAASNRGSSRDDRYKAVAKAGS
jgi:hypothetical protein